MEPEANRPVSQVLQEIVGDVQDILRSEVRLAKAEIRQEAGKAAKSTGMLGAGAFLAAYAFGFLLLTLVYALGIVVPWWAAALLVAVLVAIPAAVLIRAGLKRFKQVDITPDKTIRSVKENVEWVKSQTR